MENKVPGWFWVVSVLLLLWNLVGVSAFVSQYKMSAEAIAALPPAQQYLWNAMPAWLWAAYAIAVGAGTLGVVMLLMRKAFAVPLFALGLAGVVVQYGYIIFGTDALSKMGLLELIGLPVLIFAINLAELVLARRWRAKAWLS